VALKPTDKDASKDNPEVETTAEDEMLMREIDEAVRKDDLEQFGKKYGLPLGGGLAAILLAFGGYLFWDSQTEAGLEAESETLVSALDNFNVGNLEEAKTATAGLVDEGSPAASASALFLQATAEVQAGNNADAAVLFGQIADDETAPPALRDLALVREVATDFDNREPADIIARLERLAVPGNAFFGSAGELTAMAHLEAGDVGAAGTMFAEISRADDVPESLRSRARQMAGQLGVDAIDDVNQLLEDQGIEPENDGTQQ